MAGLLNPGVRRECRYGHGVLELLMGSFGLTGLRPLGPVASATSLLGPKTPGRREPDGRILALKVWRCPTCGYVELVDDASA